MKHLTFLLLLIVINVSAQAGVMDFFRGCSDFSGTYGYQDHFVALEQVSCDEILVKELSGRLVEVFVADKSNVKSEDYMNHPDIYEAVVDGNTIEVEDGRTFTLEDDGKLVLQQSGRKFIFR